jgi:hypothetical protein
LLKGKKLVIQAFDYTQQTFLVVLFHFVTDLALVVSNLLASLCFVFHDEAQPEKMVYLHCTIPRIEFNYSLSGYY